MILFTLGLPVFAESRSDDEIQLLYLSTYKANSYLNISEATAICESICKRDSSTRKIVATQTLEKHWGLWMWDPVSNASWTKTVSNPSSTSMSNTKSGLVNGTYRLKTEFTVTASNGQSETITVCCSEVTI